MLTGFGVAIAIEGREGALLTRCSSVARQVYCWTTYTGSSFIDAIWLSSLAFDALVRRGCCEHPNPAEQLAKEINSLSCLYYNLCGILLTHLNCKLSKWREQMKAMW